MNSEDFKNSKSGICVASGRGYEYFLPHCIPPVFSRSDFAVIEEKAKEFFKYLDILDKKLFFSEKKNEYTRRTTENWIKREAIVSSKIEGITNKILVNDNRRAILKGFRLHNIPISKRLIANIHLMLLRTKKFDRPGEFRRSQVWIGGHNIRGAIFVPPPAEKVLDCLTKWEYYYHCFQYIHPFGSLIKTAVCHQMFETIHPFLDGNGRTGRAIINLMLDKFCISFICISEAIYRDLDNYYRLLLETSKTGDYRSWVVWFIGRLIEQTKLQIKEIVPVAEEA